MRGLIVEFGLVLFGLNLFCVWGCCCLGCFQSNWSWAKKSFFSVLLLVCFGVGVGFGTISMVGRSGVVLPKSSFFLMEGRCNPAFSRRDWERSSLSCKTSPGGGPTAPFSAGLYCSLKRCFAMARVAPGSTR